MASQFRFLDGDVAPRISTFLRSLGYEDLAGRLDDRTRGMTGRAFEFGGSGPDMDAMDEALHLLYLANCEDENNRETY